MVLYIMRTALSTFSMPKAVTQIEPDSRKAERQSFRCTVYCFKIYLIFYIVVTR